MTTDAEEKRADARQHPRVKVLYLLTYMGENEGEQQTPILMGRSLDLSPAGARIEVYESIEVGAHLEVHIAIGEELISVRGTVVHVTTQKDGRTIVLGMRFDELQDALAGLTGELDA